MSTSKSFQSPQTFVPYRPSYPKLASHTPTSAYGSANSSVTSPQAKMKPSIGGEMEQLSSIFHQNSLLREENRALKRELNLMKGEVGGRDPQGVSGSGAYEVNDLRETIKKEAGQIKELKTRLEVVSKQCKMYEEIITMMENKIAKLTENNKLLEQKIYAARFPEPDAHKQKYLAMAEKVNEVVAMFNELEASYQGHEQEWESWKEQWAKEKTYYLNRIRDLEGMMGIGETKEFFKKRY